MLLYGLAPVGGITDLFGGGVPSPTFMEDLQAEVKARVVWDALGGVALIAGIVLVKVGSRKPKPPTLDELIEAKVQERLAGMQLVAPADASGPPAAVHIEARPGAAAPSPSIGGTPVKVSPPAATVQVPSQAARCPSCGLPLIAGGSFCRSCGPVR